ncbi:unnamed protein product [Rotaria magnacalcarata]|uniref:LolA-like domain-containing protein n=8 Tax=Rotaria magnacalcarata TaxID=392030 RepID=A0A816VGC3_9BILA|nr:unnamed protein product [Rotaria magnacalcarata]CAF3799730.1 unnamed protein product [Rotaria magnacalcarata]
MFRKLFLLSSIICILFRISRCQQIDLNICPNGLTPSPTDPKWPTTIPNHFEIFSEITTDIATFEVTQSFVGSHRDHIYFRTYEKNLEVYYDFDTNEIFTINDDLQCARSEMQPNENFLFITSQYLKPSILLGFDGRNNNNIGFFTRYIGEETIRGGILTEKFQSCFYIYQGNLTINATYYLTASPPNEANINRIPDFVQIDVRSNNYPYTLNIIRYVSNPSLTLTTPSGVYCPNRIQTKEFPKNLPSRLSLHSEAYTLKNSDIPSRIETFNRLIDETLKFERIDYDLGVVLKPMLPDTLFVDYAYNLTYMYTRATEQCTVQNANANPMETTTEILFQFGALGDSIKFQYTGLTTCGRKHLQCYRWIGQRNINNVIQQYEWYWSAKYNEIDLSEFIPIKVNVMTTSVVGPPKVTNQEISFFNYNPRPNSMEVIDSTISKCYRALGPSNNYNYAILRMTLNNDDKYPVHQYLLSLQNRVHMQLADDLKIRHVRLSSFVIDATRDTTDQQDKDVYITFTLLDNPPASSDSLKESSSLELIRKLARQINDGDFHVRDADGAFDLKARPNSLRTLVLYLLPSENHTNYFNETVFVYQNVTQTIIKQRQKLVYKSTGPQIAALWTGFTLLGVIVALAIGSFIAIRKWTPTVN